MRSRVKPNIRSLAKPQVETHRVYVILHWIAFYQLVREYILEEDQSRKGKTNINREGGK